MQLTALETSRVAVANASAAWLDALGIAERAAQAAVTHLIASRSRLAMAFLSRRTPVQMAALITEEAHDMIRSEILRSFTHHTVIGRHEGDMRPDLGSGPVWLVDALDGASAYLTEKPNWSVSICLVVHGKLRLGVVVDGNTHESYRALTGLGLQVAHARRANPTAPMPLAGPPNGQPTAPIALLAASPGRVDAPTHSPIGPVPDATRSHPASPTLPMPLGLDASIGPSVRQRFREASAATIFPAPGSKRMAGFSHEFGRATKAFQAVHRTTCTSLALAHVASGRLDAFWAHDQDICDTAAGMLLIQEAGAELRARDGLPLLQTRSIAACSPSLAYDFHALLAGV